MSQNNPSRPAPPNPHTGMSRCARSVARKQICFALLFLLLFSATTAQSKNSAARNGKQLKTIFLPFKIDSPTRSKTLTRAADRALEKALAAKGLTMFPRKAAMEKINYNAVWPPVAAIKKEFPPSGNTGYAAAGSLTQSGKKLSLDVVVLDLRKDAAPFRLHKEINAIKALDDAMGRIVDDILARAGRHLLVAAIDVKGNKRIDSGAILRNIKSRVGDRYDPALARADLKKIFQMGYFDDVQIDVRKSAKGKKISFRVKEKAVIKKVILAGHKKLKQTEIKEVISVTANTIVNTKEIRASLDNIRKLYKEKGFYNTEVAVKYSYPDPNQVEVRFVINEGDKVFIKKISIAGNKAFSDAKIKKVMATSEKGFFSWLTETGLLKRDILEQDVSRVNAFYHNNGYIEALVGEPEVVRKGEWLYITVNIAEGERYRVGAIDLAGDLITDKESLLKLVRVGEKEFFNRGTLRQDMLRLTDRYSEKGYAFADAKPAIQRDPSAKKVDLTIHLTKGPLVHINRIVIKGNTRTRDKVIRRQILTEEKGLFNTAALRRSQERLQRLSYFEEINITPEPTLDEDLMDIVVEVKEKPTGTFSIGAGYSSDVKMTFMAEVSQNNFLGRGQRLSLQANISGTDSKYNFSFTEPHLFDSKLLTGVDAYNWEREYDDYTKESKGGGVRFGYPLWKRWKGYFNYGYDDSELSDLKEAPAQEILDSQGATSSVKLSLVRDTRNSQYDATKGSRHIFSVKYAGGPLGGDFGFTKYEGSTSWYFPLFWGTSFHIKGTAGYVEKYKDETLPVFEKFYLGGLTTIRGFESGDISPTDEISLEKIGGDKMWYTNVEWIFPIVKDIGLKGLIFFDTGNVYDFDEVWDFSRAKRSAGFGFRWLSPMGPLRLEWGYNLDPDEEAGEDQSIWDFSIGGSF